MNLVYLDGALKECPPISEKEQRQTELNTLDRKYADKLSNIELEMAKAKAIEDEDLYTELKEEREALINEYAEKRGKSKWNVAFCVTGKWIKNRTLYK